MLCSIRLDGPETDPRDAGCAGSVRLLLGSTVPIRDRDALRSYAFRRSHKSRRGRDRDGTTRRRDRAVWAGTSGDSPGYSISFARHTELVSRTLGVMGCNITTSGHSGCGKCFRLSLCKRPRTLREESLGAISCNFESIRLAVSVHDLA